MIVAKQRSSGKQDYRSHFLMYTSVWQTGDPETSSRYLKDTCVTVQLYDMI